MKSAANICGHLWCYAVLLKETYPCTLKGLLQSGNKRQELFQHSLALPMAKPSSQPSALVYHQHMAKATVPAAAPATRTLCSSPLWLLPSQAPRARSSFHGRWMGRSGPELLGYSPSLLEELEEGQPLGLLSGSVLKRHIWKKDPAINHCCCQVY